MNTAKVLVQENLVDELLLFLSMTIPPIEQLKFASAIKSQFLPCRILSLTTWSVVKGIQLWKSVSICNSDIISLTDTEVHE